MRKWLWLIWLWPALGLAAPAVNDLTLNGGQADVILNTNDQNATVSLRLIASEPVKWNTIAICAVTDAVCSRTTAVKYFTQTATLASTVEKSWNGRRANGEAAAAGQYKVKATVKNEAGTEGSTEFSGPLIIVEAGEVVAKEATSNEGDEDEMGEEVGGGSLSESRSSAHASQAKLSTKYPKAAWQISLGRERSILAGGLVELAVVTAAGSGDGAKYRWSFGDGSAARGERAAHRYRLPGEYEVVVTGQKGDLTAVGRTKVRVLLPRFTLKWSDLYPGALVIKNDLPEEVNLGDFKLLHQGVMRFVFPLDTIVAPAGELLLDPLITGFKGNEDLELYSPAHRPVGEVLSSVTSQELKLAELKTALLAAERQLAAMAAPTASSWLRQTLTVAAPSTGSSTALAPVPLGGEGGSPLWRRWLTALGLP